MATIKGITIEIGGNTTGLQEALKDVNKNINSLSSELRQVDRLLKLDPTNTTLLAQKQDLLKKSIEGVSDKLKTLKNSQEQVEQALKNGNIGEEQYRAFQREVVQAENKLNRLNNELNETNNKTSKIDTAKMKEMETVAVATAGAVVGAVALAIAGVGRVATETITKIDDAIKKAGEYADEVMTLAKVTNLDNATVQSWGYASEFIDTETDTIVRALAKMTKGLESNKEKFEELGVTIKNQDGTYRTQHEIFLDTIEALGQYGDETERDKLAMELFGKSAQELNPLIKAGKDELSKLSQEAENMGLILSDEDLLQLGKFDDMMKKIEALNKSFGNKIALIFEPLASAIYEPFAEGFGEVNKIMADGIQEGDTEKIKDVFVTTMAKIRTILETEAPEYLAIFDEGLRLALDLLATAVPTLLPTALSGMTAIFETIGKVLKDNPEEVQKVMNALGEAIKYGIQVNAPLFTELSWEILKAMVTGAGANAGGEGLKFSDIWIWAIIGNMALDPFKEQGNEIVKNLAGGMWSGFGEAVQVAGNLANNIKSSISNGLSGMEGIGWDILRGIWQGIGGNQWWIIDKINGWAGSVVDHIKKAFDINSPSKLMEDEVGMMIGLGVAGGIMESLPAIKGAMGYLQNQVMTSSNPLINPRLATASVNNTLAPVITININGNADKSVIDYAVDKINKQLGGLI